VPQDPDTAIGGPRHQFPTTRPAIVQAATGEGPRSREALESIIALYWKPAYKHVRIQWNRSNEEAKDLVQDFFAALIEQNILARFDPAQGRLRTYLRACLDRFVMKHDQSAHRLKRGGGVHFDFDAAEREIAASTPSPDDVFFREWQREVFALALGDLRASCREGERRERYQIFERYDLSEGDRPSYADLARELGISVATVTNHLAWARRELRRLTLARSL
jgi:RNA polymerase sigma factor (sigma-70 family)